MAHAAKTMTKPTKAAVIWLLAASVFALSPPDIIHLIPPITSMKKKIIAATTRMSLIPVPIITPIDKPVNPAAKPPSGCRLIFSPTARSVVDSKLNMLIDIIEFSVGQCQVPVCLFRKSLL